MAGGPEDACIALVVLLVMLVILYILVKFAKLFAYVGAWRTGKALRKISKEGLVIRQPEQWQQPSYPPQERRRYGPTRQLRQQRQSIAQTHPSVCPYCGAIGVEGQVWCKACGRGLARQSETHSVKTPAPDRVKTNGTKFCRHCGEKIVADSKYCEHCGSRL